MHIVCPHCTTSYAVDPANFSGAGRRVRCARCQEVWLATPQELATTAGMRNRDMDDAPFGANSHAENAHTADDWQEDHTPHVESPSIAADWSDPQTTQSSAGTDDDWPSLAQQDAIADVHQPSPPSRLKKLRQTVAGFRLPTSHRFAPLLKPSNWVAAFPAAFNLPTACVAMGAVVFALIAWRTDVVRAMPQTAAFYNMIGMGVNLRGLSFEGVKISTEMVNDKPVLLIEGAIVDVTNKRMEIPRLRFIVRDSKGADIYAWNAMLEQPVLNPGETAWFKTRLASPPAEGREIAVRFFHKRDLAAGGT